MGSVVVVVTSRSGVALGDYRPLSPIESAPSCVINVVQSPGYRFTMARSPTAVRNAVYRIDPRQPARGHPERHPNWTSTTWAGLAAGNLLDRQDVSNPPVPPVVMARCPAKRRGGMEIVLAAVRPMQAADVCVYVLKADQDHESSKVHVRLERRILSGLMTIDFAETVRRRLAERGQSQYRAAVNSGLPQDAIRAVLNGHVPRLNRAGQICRALGLELYIGPARDVQVKADGAEPSRPLTRFDPNVQLPVQVLSPPSPEVHLAESGEADRTRPAPGIWTTPSVLRELPR